MSLLTIIFGFCLSNNALAEEAPSTTTETTTQTTVSPETNTQKGTETGTTTETGTATGAQTETQTGSSTETNTQTATTTEATTQTAPAVNMEKKPETKTEKKAEKKPEKSSDGHGDGHVAGQFTMEAMWAASSVPVRTVLLTLLAMLIACVYVGIERFIALNDATKKSISLQTKIEDLFTKEDFQTRILTEKLSLIKTCTESSEVCHLKSIMDTGVTEFSVRQDTYGIEGVERGLEKIMAIEMKALGKGMNILATTGATAPFVGLVGTIFGIINAFSQIGSSGGGDLMTLAPAIGEALITTAFGIMVALVGVWIFNFFTGVTDKITNQMSIQSQTFIDWCYKQSAPPLNK